MGKVQKPNVQCCMLWLPTDLLSLLKAVGGSGALQREAVPFILGLLCLLPQLPFAQAAHVKADLSKCIWLSSHVLWMRPLGSVPVAIFVLNTVQSHPCAHLLLSFWGSLGSWQYPCLRSFLSSFSLPGVRRKEYVGSCSCLKCCLSSDFTLIPRWVPGNRAKILRIAVAS